MRSKKCSDSSEQCNEYMCGIPAQSYPDEYYKDKRRKCGTLSYVLINRMNSDSKLGMTKVKT